MNMPFTMMEDSIHRDLEEVEQARDIFDISDVDIVEDVMSD